MYLHCTTHFFTKKTNIFEFKKKLKFLPLPITKAEVIEKKPEMPTTTIEGEIVCLNCNHEWTAIHVIGQQDFLCPECKTHKGTMKYFVEVRSDKYFECECGSNFFYLIKDGRNQCPICGHIFIVKGDVAIYENR